MSPLRRLRIQRAQEHGAFWARSWDHNVTHVIVDKGLVYDDILRHLKLNAFPVSQTEWVNPNQRTHADSGQVYCRSSG